jgi:ribosomal-protein-alanine N-acetyltransferase
MTAGDVGRVVAIEGVSAPTPWSASTFANELGIPFSRALVAEVEGQGVVAFAVWWRVAAELHLLNLAVAPENRRQGIARALLEEVLAEGRREAAEQMTLEVAAENAPALALYEAFGFAAVGRRRDYYGPGNDAVLLTRAFAPHDAPHKP